MKLRGIEFQPCWDAPGVRGWFGEGYWIHKPYRLLFGLDFAGSTRVAKTTTYYPNVGRMPFYGSAENFRPRELLPKSIWVNFFKSATTNAISLSGPGAIPLVQDGLLNDSLPCMISFMSIAKDKVSRLDEFRKFLKLILHCSTSLHRRFAIQINLSCPNTGLNPAHLLNEAQEMLDIAQEIGLDVPYILKFNLFAPPETVKLIADHSWCDAICGTNTIPHDQMRQLLSSPPEYLHGARDIPKHLLKESPLKRRFPSEDNVIGGYSGPELLPLVAKWGRALLDTGVIVPLNLGGGIRHPNDVDFLVETAELRPRIDTVFFASAAIVAPWNVQPIIQRAHERLG